MRPVDLFMITPVFFIDFQFNLIRFALLTFFLDSIAKPNVFLFKAMFYHNLIFGFPFNFLVQFQFHFNLQFKSPFEFNLEIHPECYCDWLPHVIPF